MTFHKSTVLGITEEVSGSVVDRINPPAEPKPRLRTNPPTKGRNEALYHKLLRGKLDYLTPEDRQKIEPILLKSARIFHDEKDNGFKGTNVIEHEILVEQLDDHSIEPPMH
jgi:hypothetical protein